VRHVLIALIAPPSTVVQLTSIRLERELVYVQEAAWGLGSLACDRVEEFLSNTGTEIRDIVAIEMLESFPNAEYPSGRDTFAQFLGPETKHLWVELQAIWETSVKLDLQDRTVLEGEVLISRILRQLSFEHCDAGYADLSGLHS